jgi:hypothetical protein
MTDIWRSFVAQRIGHEYGWHVLFHNPTVYQARNEHSLLRDFADEVPGYLNNGKIAEALQSLSLPPDKTAIGECLRRCYEAMIRLGVVADRELAILDAWLADLAALGYA